MKTINFTDINIDLMILDKYLDLTDQELVKIADNKYNLWDKWHEAFRFDESLEQHNLLEYVLDLASDYFMEDYECYNMEDYDRQAIYIHSLNLVRYYMEY